MKGPIYLFDTHALIFWKEKESVSGDFIQFFDEQAKKGCLYVSSISFWEVALLVKKKRIIIKDVVAWKNEILNNGNIQLIDPTSIEMINSVLLPDLHKDPFDRLLISQAFSHNCLLVTKDKDIKKYDLPVFWVS